MTLLVSNQGEQVNLALLNFSHISSLPPPLLGLSSTGPAKQARCWQYNLGLFTCRGFALQCEMCAFTFPMQYKCFCCLKIPVSLFPTLVCAAK